MILPFMTKFPKDSGTLTGKNTYFIHKIWLSIEKNSTVDNWILNREHCYNFSEDYKRKFDNHWHRTDNLMPKIHTIREDKTDRWKPGIMIDFFINARTKDMFRFAPRIPVVSVQNFEISYVDAFIDHVKVAEKYTIKIDGRELDWREIETLAKNDGFDSSLDFVQCFNKDFTGKIIHWTDLKY